jgi:Type I phosphodiesterase / nucleotide pyrophosphatase
LKKSIAAMALSLALLSATSPARANDDDFKSHKIEHVLLISVDGLHALDLSNYVAAHPDSALAQLSKHGYTYTNASTSTPSDSFPGLASLVTGGSPTTTGLWYDVTWNRALSPQAQGNSVMGTAGGACPGTIGAIVELDEGVDADLTQLNGGGSVNPDFLPRDPNNGCRPVFPHQYLRVNTIFEVVKAHGGLTAGSRRGPTSIPPTNGPTARAAKEWTISTGPRSTPLPSRCLLLAATPCLFPIPFPMMAGPLASPTFSATT